MSPALVRGAVLALGLAACGPQAPEPTDFAWLARSEEAYHQARPGRPLQFPRDHGAHPGFRLEWWYLTAILRDAEDRPHGVQWTLFRTALEPPGTPAEANPWFDGQAWMAHMAVTTPDGHAGFQRYARGAPSGPTTRAGVTAAPFAAWLDDWRLASEGPGWLPLRVAARQGDTAFTLRLAGQGGPVAQGEAGFSAKHAGGGGSHYYSQPFLHAEGELEVDGRRFAVSGQAWLDHEWSSQFLHPGQAGWDWLALHLDSGEKLMLFRLRPRPGAGAGHEWRHGVLLAPGGDVRPLDPARITWEEREWQRVAGRRLPLKLRIGLPEIDRRLEVRALHPEQWMDVDFPYWEGVVLATGEGPGNSGEGYLELTGYPPD